MLSRVLVLGFATALFITIWNVQNGDHRSAPGGSLVSDPAALEELRALFDGNRGPELFSPIGRLTEVPFPPSETTETATASVETEKLSIVQPSTDHAETLPAAGLAMTFPAVSLAEAVPLPAGIAPGKYCVVCSNGQTGVLALDRADLPEASAETAAPRDSYAHFDGERRWLFIRLDDVAVVATASAASDAAAFLQNAETALPATDSADDQPLEPTFEPSAPKKYDFTGYADLNDNDEDAAATR
jgi:hypothetical protein